MTERPETIFEANEVLVTDLNSELVLMDARSSLMFSLNASGRVVWNALPGTAAQLSRALQLEYGLSAQQARQDTEAVLSDLLARGLVQAAGPA